MSFRAMVRSFFTMVTAVSLSIVVGAEDGVLPESKGWVSGIVTAAPRTGVTIKKGGGGAYGSREFRDAVPFDYEHPGPFVVTLLPPDGSDPELVSGSHSIVIKSSPDRKNRRRIEPDLSVAPLGSEIVFSNQESIDLNLNSAALSAKTFNVMVPGRGTKSVKGNHRGPVFIRSFDDESLSATLYIGGTYVGLTDDKGRYKIFAPEGKYLLEAWHPRLPPRSSLVTITAGQGLETNLVLTVDTLNEPN